MLPHTRPDTYLAWPLRSLYLRELREHACTALAVNPGSTTLTKTGTEPKRSAPFTNLQFHAQVVHSFSKRHSSPPASLNDFRGSDGLAQVAVHGAWNARRGSSYRAPLTALQHLLWFKGGFGSWEGTRPALQQRRSFARPLGDFSSPCPIALPISFRIRKVSRL